MDFRNNAKVFQSTRWRLNIIVLESVWLRLTKPQWEGEPLKNKFDRWDWYILFTHSTTQQVHVQLQSQRDSCIYVPRGRNINSGILTGAKEHKSMTLEATWTPLHRRMSKLWHICKMESHATIRSCSDIQSRRLSANTKWMNFSIIVSEKTPQKTGHVT